jgi:histidinol phosphatase-like PHP family hydrolase
MRDFELFDFHTHSFLSDGVLSPIELIRRAHSAGYAGIAITDHVGYATLERVVEELKKDCRLAEKYWDIRAFAGVEITHVPPESIGEIAKAAVELGAEIVVVHGETIVEPVPEGTDLAAVQCDLVDLLAHPGNITPEVAEKAAANRVFLEITRRQGHCLTNGHVLRLGLEVGANMLVDSDAHEPGDLLTPALAKKVALGAGLQERGAGAILLDNPRLLLQRLEARK